jgi:ribosomal protein L44E
MSEPTEIKTWCPTCMGEDKHVVTMIIVKNGVVMELECGHKVKECF